MFLEALAKSGKYVRAKEREREEIENKAREERFREDVKRLSERWDEAERESTDEDSDRNNESETKNDPS